MPVQWTISHSKRLLAAVAKEEVRPRAMVDFLQSLIGRVLQWEQESEVGPIAIIALDDATFEQACQFAQKAALVRPIRVFREWHEGRRWLDAMVIDRLKAAE